MRFHRLGGAVIVRFIDSPYRGVGAGLPRPYRFSRELLAQRVKLFLIIWCNVVHRLLGGLLAEDDRMQLVDIFFVLL